MDAALQAQWGPGAGIVFKLGPCMEVGASGGLACVV